MSGYEPIRSCLCCGGQTSVVLDLGSQPPANSYLDTRAGEETEFPLRLDACAECRHMQLGHAVHPDLLFRNYLYVSGTTKTLRDYFDWFAGMVQDMAPGAKNVLEVACNDGSQLDAFRRRGFSTFGVDPAENLHPASSSRHRVECGYLNGQSLSALGEEYYDVIVAQNVLAHTADPFGMLKSLVSVMDGKTLLFVQTSQADMAQLGQFDTVYHEHISFFCVNSMQKLMARAGLLLVDVVRTPVHGGSLVFIASKDGLTRAIPFQHDDSLEFSARSRDRLASFSNRVGEMVGSVAEQVAEARQQGFSVAGYGAAAKGNTVLNYGKIMLDFIVDDNPLKQGKFTPGMRIPILSSEAAKKICQGRLKWVVLSWNFREEIEGRISGNFAEFKNEFIRMGFEA